MAQHEDQPLAMTPQEFSADYTEYYRHHDNDSPEKSRAHLINRLIADIEQRLNMKSDASDGIEHITVLDVGAGKQILERELQRHPRFAQVAEKVKIITLDIALLTKHQLLAHEVDHVMADGSRLPFATSTFDIIYSSMAIDFMPRQDAFSEIKRVAQADASFLFNFHHPDLIEKKELDTREYQRRLQHAKRQLSQIQQFAQGSRSYERRVTKLQQEIGDLETAISHDTSFFGQVFPELIFASLHEVEQFLRSAFPHAFISLSEYTNMGTNGWFAADVNVSMAEDVEEDHS